MQVTFHSTATDVPTFRDEVVTELKRRLELAKLDSRLASTANGRNVALGRVNELKSAIDFFETLRLNGDKH